MADELPAGRGAMMYDKRCWSIAAVCLLAMTSLSCQATKDAQEKAAVLKSATAFYKAFDTAPTPASEKAMELKDYHLYGYPALVYESLGLTQGVQKLEGAGDTYEVGISFWCDGTAPGGEEKKSRRSMLVRLSADPAAPNGWAVSKFKFTDDSELTGVRQFFTCLLWMFISPLMFYLALLIFAGGFLWARVALLVAYLMGIPLRIYVSYLWFGSVWGAIVAMVAWTLFELWAAQKGQQS